MNTATLKLNINRTLYIFNKLNTTQQINHLLHIVNLNENGVVGITDIATIIRNSKISNEDLSKYCKNIKSEETIFIFGTLCSLFSKSGIPITQELKTQVNKQLETIYKLYL